VATLGEIRRELQFQKTEQLLVHVAATGYETALLGNSGHLGSGLGFERMAETFEMRAWLESRGL